MLERFGHDQRQRFVAPERFSRRAPIDRRQLIEQRDLLVPESGGLQISWISAPRIAPAATPLIHPPASQPKASARGIGMWM